MHDAARRLDQGAVDPDAETQPIAVGRVSTAELTMQVAVLGVWHRRTPDLKTTACGIAYNSQFSPTRREELCHPLCRSCFTHYEVALANARAEEDSK